MLGEAFLELQVLFIRYLLEVVYFLLLELKLLLVESELAAVFEEALHVAVGQLLVLGSQLVDLVVQLHALARLLGTGVLHLLPSLFTVLLHLLRFVSGDGQLTVFYRYGGVQMLNFDLKFLALNVEPLELRLHLCRGLHLLLGQSFLLLSQVRLQCIYLLCQECVLMFSLALVRLILPLVLANFLLKSLELVLVLGLLVI